LECESSSFSDNIVFDSLKDELFSQIDKLKTSGQLSSISIYIRDLNNGPWLGIKEKDDFSPASLIKVPLLIAYYKEAETNPNLLKQNISYVPIKDDLVQDILPSVTLTPDKTYTIEELIRRMIIYSDNQAYDLLLNNIDNQILINTYTNLGIDINKAFSNPNGNILSVKSYAAFFRILFNASYLSPEMSEKALSILSKVQYQNALVKGINNPNIKISHKFGERTFTDTGEKQLHDCGIVYLPQKPHLICVMTRGSDFAKLSEAIAQISQTIYQNISQKP
jgi:beta-lactamase class A